jgi:hypothetical protein
MAHLIDKFFPLSGRPWSLAPTVVCHWRRYNIDHSTRAASNLLYPCDASPRTRGALRTSISAPRPPHRAHNAECRQAAAPALPHRCPAVRVSVTASLLVKRVLRCHFVLEPAALLHLVHRWARAFRATTPSRAWPRRGDRAGHAALCHWARPVAAGLGPKF